MLRTVLAAVGVATLSSLLFRLALFVRIYLKPSKINRYVHGKEPWALVTGASDGIGEGFAHELAAKGFNVILHGRSATKLDGVKSALSQKHPERQFQTLVLDATTATPDEIARLRFPNLTVLVNNVGAPHYLRFPERTLADVHAGMAVNATFAYMLTRQLLPQLAQPGLIVNVGSVLDGWPCAFLEPYGGAKAAVAQFSAVLRTEMAVDHGAVWDVEVLHLRVLSVATKANGETASWLHLTPRQFARAALERVGCGVESTAGCLLHDVLVWVTELLPRDWVARGVSQTVRGRIVEEKVG